MEGVLASPVVKDFRSAMQARFGGRLRRLALFGSRARREATEDSDVDILVVVDDLTASEARSAAHDAGDLVAIHGTVVSPFLLSAARFETLRRRGASIVVEIEREGLAL